MWEEVGEEVEGGRQERERERTRSQNMSEVWTGVDKEEVGWMGEAAVKKNRHVPPPPLPYSLPTDFSHLSSGRERVDELVTAASAASAAETFIWHITRRRSAPSPGAHRHNSEGGGFSLHHIIKLRIKGG